MTEQKRLIKNEIREYIRIRKREMTPEYQKQAELSCLRQLTQSDLWKKADCIYSYVSYKKEMGTHDLIKLALEEGKQVAAPRVEGDEMEFYYFTSMDQLIKGNLTILEPEPIVRAEMESALFLMPGVAFDYKKNRIGYGGGYYDKYLKRHPGHKTAALAYDFQILEEIPSEDHDIRPDYIFTQSRIIT